MKAQWLVELGLFTDTEDDLIKAIRKSGRTVKTIKYIPFDDELIMHAQKLYDADSCVVFYGSLNFGRKLRSLPWYPGVYLNEKAFECTSYYPSIGNELLHSDYLMLPYGDLIRRKDELFNMFGGLLFLRPNSGMKQFTGMVLGYPDFEEGVKLAGFYDVEPELLVVVSNAKQLLREWRFVIVDNKVVSGSLYRNWTIGPDTIIPGTTTRDYVLMNSKSVTEGCADKDAYEYAEKIAKLYHPDRAWTIDVCQHKLGEAYGERLEYKVIEIGCFSCAGMYGNDLDKVVEAVSVAAEDEWKEYQPI